MEKVCLGAALWLEVHEPRADAPSYGWSLRIDHTLSYTAPGGLRRLLRPGHRLESFGPLLRLVAQPIARARVWENGWLKIEFADESAIDVPPRWSGEAWRIVLAAHSAWLSCPLAPQRLRPRAPWSGWGFAWPSSPSAAERPPPPGATTRATRRGAPARKRARARLALTAPTRG